MKGLQFLGNRVEDAANAFIDVLKYSDQSVDYPDFKDIEPWPDEIVNMFKDALKDKPFSEISAILMYTQQSSRFDLIAELMLLSEEEVVNAIDNDLSVYAECSWDNSFYIETEDEQDNYSEW